MNKMLYERHGYLRGQRDMLKHHNRLSNASLPDLQRMLDNINYELQVTNSVINEQELTNLVAPKPEVADE